MPPLHTNTMLDSITITDLNLTCIIGIYDSERLKPQPLNLSLTVWLDSRQAARHSDITASLDYASLTDDIEFILTHGRFQLIETAAEAIAFYILRPWMQSGLTRRLKYAEVKITKPEAMAAKALPQITVTRSAQECTDINWPFKTIYDCPDCTIKWRLASEAAQAPASGICHERQVQLSNDIEQPCYLSITCHDPLLLKENSFATQPSHSG